MEIVGNVFVNIRCKFLHFCIQKFPFVEVADSTEQQ